MQVPDVLVGLLLGLLGGLLFTTWVLFQALARDDRQGIGGKQPSCAQGVCHDVGHVAVPQGQVRGVPLCTEMARVALDPWFADDDEHNGKGKKQKEDKKGEDTLDLKIDNQEKEQKGGDALLVTTEQGGTREELANPLTADAEAGAENADGLSLEPCGAQAAGEKEEAGEDLTAAVAMRFLVNCSKRWTDMSEEVYQERRADDDDYDQQWMQEKPCVMTTGVPFVQVVSRGKAKRQRKLERRREEASLAAKPVPEFRARHKKGREASGVGHGVGHVAVPQGQVREVPRCTEMARGELDPWFADDDEHNGKGNTQKEDKTGEDTFGSKMDKQEEEQKAEDARTFSEQFADNPAADAEAGAGFSLEPCGAQATEEKEEAGEDPTAAGAMRLQGNCSKRWADMYDEDDYDEQGKQEKPELVTARLSAKPVIDPRARRRKGREAKPASRRSSWSPSWRREQQHLAAIYWQLSVEDRAEMRRDCPAVCGHLE
jgi:hypothetical protein